VRSADGQIGRWADRQWAVGATALGIRVSHSTSQITDFRSQNEFLISAPNYRFQTRISVPRSGFQIAGPRMEASEI